MHVNLIKLCVVCVCVCIGVWLAPPSCSSPCLVFTTLCSPSHLKMSASERDWSLSWDLDPSRYTFYNSPSVRFQLKRNTRWWMREHSGIINHLSILDTKWLLKRVLVIFRPCLLPSQCVQVLSYAAILPIKVEDSSWPLKLLLTTKR